MTAIGESGHSGFGSKKLLDDRLLYALKQTFSYYCPEGPLLTQSRHSELPDTEADSRP
jgi:hypothetical protein